ncbi:RNA polymerase sigma factor [Haloferula chungangensis]|uniref:RNA polymerase sigma factor n=1 Tax=Haloferula chungangensis TaxID=1048331 RepID=A0ABW2L7L8_9BACT
MSHTPESPRPAAHQLADHLFRHESGKMISILVGSFGARHLQLAEDVVQESLIRALRSWPVHGIPEKPQAWLLKTARNLAIDQLRREKRFLEKQLELLAELERADHCDEVTDEAIDPQLSMIFVCCHPLIPPESQAALALKTLCGFSPAEIANAFLVSEDAVTKRLTRARQRIRESGLAFQMPAVPEWPERLDGVLKVIYLLFNEGHKASQGDEIVRAELCSEALRLAHLLTRHPAGNQPQTHALIALMAFTAARFPARVDESGKLLRLEDQNRGLWDQNLIHTGVTHLALASVGSELSDYHLQAGIAACHTLARSDATTDWQRILISYDLLLERQASPIVALNRAVAISKVDGPDAALQAIDHSGIRQRLGNYHLFHAVLGELEVARGCPSAAAQHFREALSSVETTPERAHLEARLKSCIE